MRAQGHDSIDEADVPVNPAVGRLVFGWLLVGVPLAYGVITTLQRAQLLAGL